MKLASIFRNRLVVIYTSPGDWDAQIKLTLGERSLSEEGSRKPQPTLKELLFLAGLATNVKVRDTRRGKIPT